MARRTIAARDWAALILRVALGATFILHGYPKLFPNGPAGFAGFVQSLGFPAPTALAWIVALVEFVGGIAMILGLLVRYVAPLMVIEMTVTSLRVKAAGGVGFIEMNRAGWELDFLLWAIALALLLLGGGALSLDAAVARPRRP